MHFEMPLEGPNRRTCCINLVDKDIEFGDLPDARYFEELVTCDGNHIIARIFQCVSGVIVAVIHPSSLGHNRRLIYDAERLIRSKFDNKKLKVTEFIH